MTASPLALYLHLPWCIQKCPYCDFNSHALKGDLPEQAYIEALLQQIDHHQDLLAKRPLTSLFFGGGTPSLFSAKALARILNHLDAIQSLANLEITLEANPGTFEQARFAAYQTIGINRLSLGIQSFDDTALKALGRIHNGQQSHRAIDHAKTMGFAHINLDLMFALPQQTLEGACQDLQSALDHQPDHLSWYQLTLEPNTAFYHRPPPLPQHDLCSHMMQQGHTMIAEHGFEHYEVSAYCQPKHPCQHNLHIWRFGDYLGLGAGAHSKITDEQGIHRWLNPKHPKAYLQDPTKQINVTTLSNQDKVFEYMLGHLRLYQPIDLVHFSQATGLDGSHLETALAHAHTMQWIVFSPEGFSITELGRLWLDDLTALFLPKENSHG